MTSFNKNSECAFTLIELLAVIATLAFFAVTLFPALAKTKPNTNALQCLNNNRRLCNAWRMYADDNRDRIVYAGDDGTGNSNPLNQYAWTQTRVDWNPSDRGNWDIAVDIMVRPLWAYTGQNASIYKCPSDMSSVVVAGVRKPRVRSMRMNLYLGGFAGTDGGLPSAHPFNIYTNFVQTGGSLPSPGPAKLWVFMDQRDDAVNWGNFMTDMTGYAPTNPTAYTFQDFPGMYHHLAAGFSFVDGHCEMHRWTDPRTTPPPFPSQIVLPSPVASPRNSDIAWLQDHSTRPK